MITVSGHGNIVADPELRETKSGKAVATIRIAAWNGKDEKLFIDLEAWDDLAYNASRTLAKGHRVTFTGRLREDSWEGKEGETRRKSKISLQEIGPALTWATAQVTKVGGHGVSNDEGREQVARARDRIDEGRRGVAEEMPF